MGYNIVDRGPKFGKNCQNSGLEGRNKAGSLLARAWMVGPDGPHATKLLGFYRYCKKISIKSVVYLYIKLFFTYNRVETL